MHKTCWRFRPVPLRGDPPEARRAIGRAQCNDAYWHGVFGGLYLPHLRSAIWRQLAIAERVLRLGESLAYEELDLDYDGYPELWVHSSQFSALISPHRGGAIEFLTHSRSLVADVLCDVAKCITSCPSTNIRPRSETGTQAFTTSKAARLTELPPVMPSHARFWSTTTRRMSRRRCTRRLRHCGRGPPCRAPDGAPRGRFHHYRAAG
jgi:alpha-amylase/alpha-mannosidase (GH57 family)